MSTHAESKFELTGWEENPYNELDDGTKFTRAHIGQRLAGDVEGELSSEVLMFYRADGTAVYTGLDHIVGRVGDRSGSFVLQSTGSYDKAAANSTGTVVPGSGTGDLQGLTGSVTSRSEAGEGGGTFALDYDLG
jgi:hypothetical protein